MDSCFALLGARQHCVAKICKMTRSIYQVPYFELTCAPKHALPHHLFRGARRHSVKIGVSKSKRTNVAGQGHPKHLNIQPHGQYHALKTQCIGSEKTYGPKIHKWETRNCKGPHTINVLWRSFWIFNTRSASAKSGTEITEVWDWRENSQILGGSNRSPSIIKSFS